MYWIGSAMLISTGILYCLFAKSELKSWNSPAKKGDEEEEDDKNDDVELLTVQTKNGNDDDTNGLNVPSRTLVNCKNDENKMSLIGNKN